VLSHKLVQQSSAFTLHVSFYVPSIKI